MVNHSSKLAYNDYNSNSSIERVIWVDSDTWMAERLVENVVVLTIMQPVNL